MDGGRLTIDLLNEAESTIIIKWLLTRGYEIDVKPDNTGAIAFLNFREVIYDELTEYEEPIKAPVVETAVAKPARNPKVDDAKAAELFRAGLNQKQVAEELGVSPTTIKNHMDKINAYTAEMEVEI